MSSRFLYGFDLPLVKRYHHHVPNLYISPEVLSLSAVIYCNVCFVVDFAGCVGAFVFESDILGRGVGAALGGD